jgi:toxin ParE1/3/4
LTGIWTFIAQDDAKSASEFLSKVDDEIQRLGAFPHIGPKREEWGEGYRSLAYRRYVIVYRLRGDAVEILRVMSGYRDIGAEF